MKLLMIEDDPIWQSKIQQMLEELGYTDLEVYDSLIGAEQLIEASQPHLIISDVILGNSLIFDLFKNGAHTQLHFIFITTSESTSHYELSKKIPNSLYLVKPFHKISLAAAIDKLSININKALKIYGITVKGNQNERIYLPTEQIVYVKAELNYCIIKTKHNQFAIKKSLLTLINELGPQMLQIHRSVIVNKKQIDKIQLQNNEIITALGKLPVGRQYKQNVMNVLAERTII